MRSPSMAEAVQAEPRHPEQAQELNETMVALIIDYTLENVQQILCTSHKASYACTMPERVWGHVWCDVRN